MAKDFNMTTIPNISPASIKPQAPAFKGNSEQQVEKAPEENKSHLLRNSLIALAAVGGTYALAKHGKLGKSMQDFVGGAKSKGTDDITDATKKGIDEAAEESVVKQEVPKSEVPKSEVPKQEAPKQEASKPVAKPVEKLTPQEAAQKLYKEKLDFLVIADEKNVNKANVMTKKGHAVEIKDYDAIRNKNGEIIGAKLVEGGKTTTFINGLPKKEVTVTRDPKTKKLVSKTTTVDKKSTTKSYNKANRAFTTKHPDGTEVTTKLEYTTAKKGAKATVAKKTMTTTTPVKDEKGKITHHKTTIESTEKTKDGSITIIKESEKGATSTKTVTKTTDKNDVVKETIIDKNKTEISKEDGKLQSIQFDKGGKITLKDDVLTYTEGKNTTRYFKKEGDTLVQYSDKKCENQLRTLSAIKNEKTSKMEYIQEGVKTTDAKKPMDSAAQKIFTTITENM